MKNYQTVFVVLVSCSHQGTCGINACLVEGHFICKMKFLVAPANGYAQPKFELGHFSSSNFSYFQVVAVTSTHWENGNKKQGVTEDLRTYRRQFVVY